MNELLSKLPNWLQSLILALFVAAAAYLTQNQAVTWGGLVAAILAGLGNWFTTNQEKEKNKTPGIKIPLEVPSDPNSGGSTNF